MLNTILKKVSHGLGTLSEKVQPFMHNGKIQEFWNWVDRKWYRTDYKK
ncbi:MAG: hypothetical protein Q4A45_05925 [Clostridia bacterium]|nr:hypothetical protein [Clostridia bacterium]